MMFLFLFISLSMRTMWYLLQEYLTDDVTILVDTGDAQFNAMKFKLPEKTGYAAATQHQYAWKAKTVIVCT